MTNHLDDAKRLLGPAYVDQEDRKLAIAHALVAIAEHLAGQPQPGPGRCGSLAPSMKPVERQECCALLSGHAGWHRGDYGSEWNDPQTQHETSRDAQLAAALQTLAEVRKLVEYADLTGQTVLAVDAVRQALDGVDGETIGGRCTSDVTLRNDGHRLVHCHLPAGHVAVHTDGRGVSWTDGETDG